MAITLDGSSGITTPGLTDSGNLSVTGTSTLTGALNGSGYSPYTMKNRIINGAMVIDQRNAGASVTITNNTTYTLDRWIPYTAQASKFSVQQQSSVVPTGFTYATKITSLSAYTPISSDYFSFNQRIEGYNIADLAWGTANAKTVTLSFWVYSSLTGTFGGAIGNDGARSYPFSYTISSANTWEQKTVTITGDTSGSYNSTNSSGITLRFGIGAGSSYQGTAGSWSGGDYVTCTGATNIVATNGATFYITGVQLEKGSTATEFEWRPYGNELALCQRYYAKNQGSATYTGFGAGAWFSTTQCNIYMKYPQAMRASPTIGYGGTVSCMINGGTQVNISGTGTVYAATDSCMIQPTGLSGATTGQGTTMTANNDTTAYISFSAEL